MPKKMLIDATHAEETRVVVVDGNKVEEFDFESASRRQLAGNIYLAKVTRVEPSLQAAFVDYGGNRHGFLAFSEIHPDYYQIPIADREALLAEERELAESQRDEDEAEDEDRARGGNGGGLKNGRRRPRGRTRAAGSNGDVVATQAVGDNGHDQAHDHDHDHAHDHFTVPEIAGMETIDLGEGASDVDGSPEGLSPMVTVADTPVETPVSGDEELSDSGEDRGNLDVIEKDDTIETVATEDDSEDMRPARKPRAKRYKIQEVIKVRQIMLVQVVKEERGNKGAALTTYLSLAGRYCVLMPNTARGGGISRKITNAVDRKKLKEIAAEIDVPDGAGLIIRTAGSQRTKSEIKRDYEYLQRLWEQIRELTLKSIAPAKIYEEGDLIKRSIRDLYSKDIDEVLVEGEAGYRTARDFMKMIMPSHAKSVIRYDESLPLFARHQVEGYLASMFNPTVQLPSGGYIVIGVTEALVAIDVNSGRATKEGSIEQTALKTNLEAADEVARQLRLRDLAGLIVIDFIDMDERKNNIAVEKRFKDKLKTDRARIQVGRISGFGLMEMSRQRLRPGMLEATTQPCPHCHGTGLLRSDDNVSLAILRQLEEEGVRGRTKEALVKVPVGIMNFLMNHKREHIAVIEERYSMAVRVEGDLSLISPDFAIEKFKTATRALPELLTPVISGNSTMMEDEVLEDEVIEDEADEEAQAEATAAADHEPAAESDDKPRKKRRRRRRRRGGNGDGSSLDAALSSDDKDSDDASGDDDDEAEGDEPATMVAPAAKEATRGKRTRVRSRRGDALAPIAAEVGADEPVVTAEAEVPVNESAAEAVEEPGRPKSRSRSRSKKADEATPEATVAEEPKAAKPSRSRKPKASPVAEEAPDVVADVTETAVEVMAEAAPEPAPLVEKVVAPALVAPVVEVPAAAKELEPERARRKGWWNLGKG
ncbi:MAG: Rne/Rng family ribonuclease [Rhodobacterales bacterium]|nr:Rne/Rng family ribonuclease [Rhodobacterales bacterium]